MNTFSCLPLKLTVAEDYYFLICGIILPGILRNMFLLLSF